MKINIRNQALLLGFASILFFPLDTYRIEIPFISLSIFRFFLLFWSFTNFIVILTKPILPISKSALVVLIGSLLSTFFAFSRSAFITESFPFLFNEVMGFLIIINSIITFQKTDLPKVLYFYILSQLIPLFFSIFNFYQFTVNGLIFDSLPAIPGLENFIIPYKFNASDFSGLPRLWMPFVTGPHLALSISLAIIYLNYFLVKKNIFMKILLPLFLLVLLGTFSRTSMIAVLIVLIFGKGINLKLISNSIKFLIILMIISISIAYVSPDYFDNFVRLNIRRFDTSITDDRHFLLVLDAIRIWLSEVKIFLFGIGMYNNDLYTGFYTFLPPGSSFLSTYFTTLTERGIVGFTLVFSPFIYIINKSLNFNKYKLDYLKAINMGTLLILISFMFYDLRLLIPVWFHIAFCFVSLKKQLK